MACVSPVIQVGTVEPLLEIPFQGLLGLGIKRVVNRDRVGRTVILLGLDRQFGVKARVSRGKFADTEAGHSGDRRRGYVVTRRIASAV